MNKILFRWKFITHLSLVYIFMIKLCCTSEHKKMCVYVCGMEFMLYWARISEASGKSISEWNEIQGEEEMLYICNKFCIISHAFVLDSLFGGRIMKNYCLSTSHFVSLLTPTNSHASEKKRRQKNYFIPDLKTLPIFSHMSKVSHLSSQSKFTANSKVSFL